MNTVPISSSNSSDDLITPRYNVRFKYFTDKHGTEHLYEQLFSSKPVFKDKNDPDFDPPAPPKAPKGETTKDNTDRARRRARCKFTDYAYATYTLDIFVTMTIADEELRYNKTATLKKLINWLNNLVQRRQLAYLLVPELHKDGALHFHALCNSSALDLVDSGTVLIPERKKPVKRDTARRINPDTAQWQTVYNVQNWTLGFTTAVFLYGNINSAIAYVSKYISKTLEKIGGRYFYHGGDIKSPRLCYAFFSVDTFDKIRYSWGTFDDDNTYTFTAGGSEFKAQRFPVDWR